MKYPHFSEDRGVFREWMDEMVERYNGPEFIAKDPISIPAKFQKIPDREIAGFFAAILAWGNRTTILNKCRELLERMDNSPHAFITNYEPSDLKQLEGFAHRTFNDTDLLYFVHRLRRIYLEEGSLEQAFFHRSEKSGEQRVEKALSGFHMRFFEDTNAPGRTRKHVASPQKGSACKRLNMFLRWMVRKDDNGVDFGIWTAVRPGELYCPLDVHVARIARKLGLLNRKQDDWKACVELNQNLRLLDADDPVKYDYALFGIGINKLMK